MVAFFCQLSRVDKTKHTKNTLIQTNKTNQKTTQAKSDSNKHFFGWWRKSDLDRFHSMLNFAPFFYLIICHLLPVESVNGQYLFIKVASHPFEKWQ